MPSTFHTAADTAQSFGSTHLVLLDVKSRCQAVLLDNEDLSLMPNMYSVLDVSHHAKPDDFAQCPKTSYTTYFPL